MGLADAVRTVMVNEGLGEEFIPPVVSSGFDVLDYANGKIAINEDDEEEIVVGFDVGKMIMIIGQSGTAKTSLAVQMGKNIIDPFGDLGFVQHQDFERSTSDERIMNLYGCRTRAELSKKCVHPLKDLNTETTFNLIKRIVDIKTCVLEMKGLRGKARLEFPNPYMVEHANDARKMMLVPTPLIIDSLATMMPKSVDEDGDLAGNMSGAATAKKNTSFFKGLLGDFIDGAILPIIINHITVKININSFIPMAADINYLKQDESLPGGKAAMFLTNTMFKLVASKKLNYGSDFNIKGFIVRAELIKSRSNFSGISCELVYDQVNGFDNILSNFLLMKNNKLIGGGGKSSFVKGYEDVKFTQATYKDAYLSDDKFADFVDDLVQDLLIKTIPRPEMYGQEIDVDEEILKAFEIFKKRNKLVPVELDGDEEEYWEHPKSGVIYDSIGDVVEMDDE